MSTTKNTFLNSRLDLLKGYFLMSIFLLSLLSCKKRLDKKPEGNLSTPETLQDLQQLLDYDNIQGGSAFGYGMNQNATPSGSEAAADNYFITQTYFNSVINYPPRNLTYIWRYDPNFLYQDDDWQRAYKAVYVANVCLENLPKIERTTANKTAWDNVKGSALFFKAYYYLQLSWEYAKAYDASTAPTDKGIPLKSSTSIDDPTTRSSVKQCYDNIIADAKESLNYLPTTGLNCERPSKATVYGLLARTFLSMRQYDSAFKYSDLCLQLNSQLMNFNGDPDIVAPVIGSDAPFRKFNKETIFFSSMNSYHNSVIQYNAYVDSALYSSYDANDIRRQIFFNGTGSLQRFKGSYSQTNDAALFTGIAADEMLLTRTECKARLGDRNGALTDLNNLLITRWKNGTFIPFTATTADQALDIILTERRKELIFRGLRWMDIKRLNKEGRGIIIRRYLNNQFYDLLPNDERYALYIPPAIIQLTGMPQNEGW